MDNSSSTKRFLQDKARDVGFAQCRIASAEPLPSAQLLAWLNREQHGTMRWLARDPVKRCDPASLLHGAKSVICCALPYGDHGLSHAQGRHDAEHTRRYTRGHGAPADAAASAKLYRGDDYHEVVRAKLDALAGELKKSCPGARTKCCVDTSPILEKALAARAGLGWIGKNTLLVDRAMGSWFVLGEIITDVELEADLPVEDGCGGCRRCIEACPTKALGPRSLDARRCLAYLTIEHRGDIPAEFAEHMCADAYGCDLCQEVCPFNAEICD